MYGDSFGVAGTFGVLFVLGIVVLFWIGPAVLTWWLAIERGRDGNAWFVAALLLGPLALLAVGLSPVTSSLACTECKEPVREGAKVCPHCHTRFGQPVAGARSWAPAQAPTPAPARPSAPATPRTGEDASAARSPLDPTPRPAASSLGHAVLAKTWKDAPAGAPPGVWTIAGSTTPMLDPGDTVTFRDERGAVGIYNAAGAKRDLLIDGEYRFGVSDEAPGELLIERPRGRPEVHLRRG